MLRIALDTNVWISAFMTRGGVCEKLVLCPHKEPVRLVASPFILQEVERVLSDKLSMPEPMVKKRLHYIVMNSLLVDPGYPRKPVSGCEGDDRVLECARAGGVSYLVTGDKSHLLVLKKHEGIEIVTPRRMVELLRL